MTLIEYIDTKYPIEDKIRLLREDPITRVMNADCLPCDKVAVFDGELQKVVYLNDAGECIPVLELLSYDEADIRKLGQCDLSNAWYAYMKLVSSKDVDLDDYIAMSRTYMPVQKKREELLKRCTL